MDREAPLLTDVARLPVREVVSALTLGLGTVVFDYMAKQPRGEDPGFFSNSYITIRN